MTFDKTKAMRNAEKFLAQGKIKSAIIEYELVAKFDTKDFGTVNTLGDLYVKTTDTNAAIRCYSIVADHYSKQGFAQKAIAIYNKISRLAPHSFEVWHKLADLYKQKGSVNEARAHYQKVAGHYEKVGEKIQALAMWREIALLDPTDTASYLSLADSYLAEEQTEDAHEAYTECGNRFAKKDDHENAVKSFDKALGLKKEVPSVIEGLVRSLQALDRGAEAAERLAGFLTEFPHSREIRVLYIDCLIQQGEIAEAEKAVIRLVEMEPANYPKFLELAQLYLDGDDVVAATRILAMSSEHMLVGGQADQFDRLVKAVLEKDPEQLDALRLHARYCSWQRDEEALCSALAKLAEVAFAAESVEDERYALLQLTMLVPHNVGYADRLREINAEHGFEGSDGEENLFDKRFLKNGSGPSVPAGFITAEPLPADGTAGADSGFEFIGHVTEVGGNDEGVDLARLRKEIDSIRFYIDNGYAELAEKAAQELHGEFGDRPEVVALLAEIGAVPASAGGDGPREFDPSKLHDELGIDEAGFGDGPDYETHFNTAVAYQEMGLMEDAIKEFQSAISLVRPNDGTRRFFSCANLLGHCFMQQGRPHLAQGWFERSLEVGDLTKEEKQGLWYELASAHEADGNIERAGRYYEQVYAENVDFRDVSERIRTIAVNN